MRPFLLLFLLFFLFINTQAQVIFDENLDAGLPAGWSVIDGGTSLDTWQFVPDFGGNSLDGTPFIFVNSDAAGNAPSPVLTEVFRSPAFNGNLYPAVYLDYDHYYRFFTGDSGFVEVWDGSQWAVVASYGASIGNWAAPNQPSLNLTAYRNPAMQIRFRYEDYGTWAWYWALDNIRVYAPIADDAQMVSLQSPVSDCGLGAAEDVTIQVFNNGQNTINTLPVSYKINAAAPVTETITTPIAPGQTYTHTFATPANLAAPGSYNFTLYTQLAGDGDLSNDTLSGIIIFNTPQVNSFPYLEDFESGAGGWAAGGINSTWVRGLPAKNTIIGAASGTKAWVTGGLGTGDYLDNDNSWVKGPCFDFSGLTDPWIGLDIWWNSENSWDGAALQASSDFGTTWLTIGTYNNPYNWYNDFSIDGNPGGQQNGWTGRASEGNGSNGYVFAKHEMYLFAGESSVMIRVAFGSDGSVTDDGFAFDNVRISNAPTTALGADTAACDSVLLDAGTHSLIEWGNGETTQTIWASQSGTYTVLVTDINGFCASDSIQVTIYPDNEPQLGADTSVCGGNPVLLDAGANGTAYLWSTGATTPTLIVSQTGTYSVQVDFGTSCTRYDTIDVFFASLNPGFFGPDSVCRGLGVQYFDTTAGATSWLWDFGDGTTSTLQNPIHVYSSGGTFLLKMTAYTGACGFTAQKIVYADICLGNDISLGSRLQVYPNPSSGKITFLIENIPASGFRLSLTDIAGRQIFISSERLMIDNGRGELVLPEQLADGIYLLELTHEFGKYREKILLKR